jgi:hypothetical protein
MELEFSQQTFEKHSKIKLHEILPVGNELLHVDEQK